jgi:hypothetical protein
MMRGWALGLATDATEISESHGPMSRATTSGAPWPRAQRRGTHRAPLVTNQIEVHPFIDQDKMQAEGGQRQMQIYP